LSHIQDTLKLAASIPHVLQLSAVVTYSSLRKHLTCSFETYLREVVGTLREDVAALLRAADVMQLPLDKQIGLVAIYLDQMQTSTDMRLSVFLTELTDSVATANAARDMRKEEEQFLSRVFDRDQAVTPAPLPVQAPVQVPAQLPVAAPGPAQAPAGVAPLPPPFPPQPVMQEPPQQYPPAYAMPAFPNQPQLAPQYMGQIPVQPGPPVFTAPAWPQQPVTLGVGAPVVQLPAAGSVAVPAFPGLAVTPPMVQSPPLPTGELSRAEAPPVVVVPSPAEAPSSTPAVEPLSLPPVAQEPELPPLEARPPIIPAPEWLKPGARVKYLHGPATHLAIVESVEGKHANLWCDSGSRYCNVAAQYLEPAPGTPVESTWHIGSGTAQRILDIMNSDDGSVDGYEPGELVMQLACGCTGSGLTGNRIDWILDIVAGGVAGSRPYLSHRLEEYTPGSADTICVAATQTPLEKGEFADLVSVASVCTISHGGVTYVLKCELHDPSTKTETKAKPKSSPVKASVKRATKKAK